MRNRPRSRARLMAWSGLVTAVLLAALAGPALLPLLHDHDHGAVDGACDDGHSSLQVEAWIPEPAGFCALCQTSFSPHSLAESALAFSEELDRGACLDPLAPLPPSIAGRFAASRGPPRAV